MNRVGSFHCRLPPRAFLSIWENRDEGFVKEFTIDMEVKSAGIEFEVRTPDGSAHIGDCYVTMSGLVWCDGKTSKANGTKIEWSDFQVILASKNLSKPRSMARNMLRKL
jgi:hypothetical protein